MRQTFLQDFFLNGIDPQNLETPLDEEFERVGSAVEDLNQTLLKRLDGTERSLFIQFETESSRYAALFAERGFLIGMRLGARMVHELLRDQG